MRAYVPAGDMTAAGSTRRSSGAELRHLTDISAEYGTAMIREFNRIDSGILMLETSVSLTGRFGSFSLEFRNDSDKPVYKLVTRNGGWCIATDSGETPLDGTGVARHTDSAYTRP